MRWSGLSPEVGLKGPTILLSQMLALSHWAVHLNSSHQMELGLVWPEHQPGKAGKQKAKSVSMYSRKNE